MVVGTGCFGGGNKDKSNGDLSRNVVNFLRYTDNDFTLVVPEEWDTITQFTSGYPSGTVVAFRNNLKEEIFTSNMSVTIETADPSISSQDFALEKKDLLREQMIDFQLIDQTAHSISISGQPTSTYIHTFVGKNDPTSDLIEFKQVYASKDGKGYTATGAYLYDSTDSNVINAILHSLETFEIN